MGPRASLIHFIFWNWVIGQAILSRGILILCWVEPSAQNSICISNNPSHKKPTKPNSYLSWLARNLCTLTRNLRAPNAEALRSVGPDHFVGDWGGINTSSLHPQRSSSPHSLRHEPKLSLSQAWCSQLPCSNLCDSLRDLALESVRKLMKILLLCSCALGEALAAWCVHYSWILAPRWLAVAR
jgi:hypothetical protein